MTPRPIHPETVLDRLLAAVEEGRSTTREIHEARSAARDVLKQQRDVIARTIAEEVERQVATALEAIQSETRERLSNEVDAIATTLRDRLGL